MTGLEQLAVVAAGFGAGILTLDSGCRVVTELPGSSGGWSAPRGCQRVEHRRNDARWIERVVGLPARTSGTPAGHGRGHRHQHGWFGRGRHTPVGAATRGFRDCGSLVDPRHLCPRRRTAPNLFLASQAARGRLGGTAHVDVKDDHCLCRVDRRLRRVLWCRLGRDDAGRAGVRLDIELRITNALKTLAVLAANLVAALIFVFAAHLEWTAVALLAIGSVVGGYVGAHSGRRLPPHCFGH